MASSKDRQRALARAKLERQMARRAAAARRRRQIQAGIAAVAALALVVVGAWWLIDKYGGSEQQEATDQGPCSYTSLPEAERQPADKDVGLPSTKDLPTSGVRTMTLTTNQGAIEIELDVTKAPCIANSFAHLVGKKFYDNTSCHRMTVENSYMLQCGDPQEKPDGTGGPTYKYADENLPTSTPPYPRGTVAMANSGPGTNGSQFFLVFKDSNFDGPKYSVAGRVTKGLEILDKIAAGGVTPSDPASTGEGAPKTPVKITTVTLGPVQPAPPSPTATTPPPTATPSSPAPSGSQSAKS